MTLNDYQQRALKTAEYPDITKNVLYPAAGMAGEGGEALEKVKKKWRKIGYVPSHTDFTDEERLEIAKEIGDVLWYAAAFAAELGMGLDGVAQINLDKLADRLARGVIKSEGDNR